MRGKGLKVELEIIKTGEKVTFDFDHAERILKIEAKRRPSLRDYSLSEHSKYLFEDGKIINKRNIQADKDAKEL